MQLQIGSILHLPFLLYGVSYVAFVILWIQGNPRQQYTLPVSTWTLVGASMGNGLIWSAGILAVFVGICRAAMGVDWPVWGPVLLAATAYACAQAAVWGMFLGHRSNLCDMGSFEATRPLTDHQLAMAILKNVALTVATSAALWFGLLAIPLLAYYLAGHGPELFALWEPPRPFPTMAGLLLATLFYCSLAWTPVALGATLFLARRWLVHTVVMGGPAAAIVGLFVWKYGLPGELQHLASEAIFGALGAACFLAAPVGFLLGHRFGVTNGRALRLGLGVWLFSVVVVAGLSFFLAFTKFFDLVLLVGLLTLPIAPFALAPLAVAWNRHR